MKHRTWGVLSMPRLTKARSAKASNTWPSPALRLARFDGLSGKTWASSADASSEPSSGTAASLYRHPSGILRLRQLSQGHSRLHWWARLAIWIGEMSRGPGSDVDWREGRRNVGKRPRARLGSQVIMGRGKGGMCIDLDMGACVVGRWRRCEAMRQGLGNDGDLPFAFSADTRRRQIDSSPSRRERRWRSCWAKR